MNTLRSVLTGVNSVVTDLPRESLLVDRVGE